VSKMATGRAMPIYVVFFVVKFATVCRPLMERTE
jgi:hypothetical protein